MEKAATAIAHDEGKKRSLLLENENEKALCFICNRREIQGKCGICFFPQCRKRASSNRFVGTKSKEPKLVGAPKEQRKLCYYCNVRKVNDGCVLCFDVHCIRQHQLAKFTPRYMVRNITRDENSSSASQYTSDEDDTTDKTNYSSSGDDLSCPSNVSDSSNAISSIQSSEDEESHMSVNSDDGSVTSDNYSSLDTESDDSEEDHVLNTPLMCENCKRQAIFGEIEEEEILLDSLSYHFHIHNVEKRLIRFRRGFCNMTARHYTTEDVILLCTHCETYLTVEGRDAETTEVKFPGYIWKLYSKIFQHQQNEKKRLWEIFPIVWRRWWQDAFQQAVVNLPPCQTIEIGIIQKKFQRGIEKNTLKALVDTFHELINPVVLCPWGCTEYYHQCGNIAFDLILQQHFQHIDLPLLSPQKISKVASSRLDFLRDSLEEYTGLLLNPSWRPLPSIYWLKHVGPVFGTCRNHHNGTDKTYFHVPRFPEFSAIPAAKPDQLCHAVLKPRTLRPMRRATFNTSYETVEMRGAYGGIDTCNLVEYGNFLFQSHLTNRNENLSILQRPDIRALVGLLVAENVLTPRAANNMIQVAEESFQGCDFKKYLKGATYMTMEDCVSLQRLLTKEESVTLTASRTAGLETRKTLIPLWPQVLVWVHPAACPFGARFKDIPLFRRRAVETQLIWFLFGMLSMVPEIWSSTIYELKYINQWNGWFLTQVANECFKFKRTVNRGGKDVHPFKKRKWKVSTLLNKIGGNFAGCPYQPSHITQAFGHNEHVACLPLNEDVNLSIRSVQTDKEVCIIFNPGGFTAENNIEGWLQSDVQEAGPEGLHFELVWLGFEWTSRTGSTWEGFILGRHGTHHRGWWAQRRGGKAYHAGMAEHGNYVEDWSKFCYAVYARRNKPDMRNMRDEYLSYLGGQNKIFCSEHALPLVVTPIIKTTRVGYKCYEVSQREQGQQLTYCEGRVGFRCPRSRCCTWICKDCMAAKCASGRKHYKEQHPGSRNGGSDVVAPTVFDSIQHEDNTTGQEVSTNWNDVVNPPSDDLLESFITESDLPIDDLHLPTDYGNEDEAGAFLPTTNAGAQPYQICQPQETSNYQVSVHVVLNQCGTLLVRNRNELKGTFTQRFFLQKLVSSSSVSIPTCYFEAMLFPSVFYASAQDGYSHIGAIPSPLLGQQSRVSSGGYASLRDHMRARFTNYDSITGTDSQYKAFGFDALANASLNNQDSRLVMHRGFEQSNNTTGLAVRAAKDAFLSDMIDSRTVIQELSAAEKDDPFTLFFSLTCNQSKQPGIRHLRDWIRSGKWKLLYAADFYDYDWRDQDEIENQLDQAASGLILRNWLEIRKLFLEHIETSNDPRLFCTVTHLFARDEYQDAGAKKALGNLPHLHMMIRTKEKPWNEEGRKALENIIRGYAEDIMRECEVQQYIEEGFLSNINDDVFELQFDAADKLGHGKCSFPRCLERIGPGDSDFRCRVPDNYVRSPNHTCHSYCEKQPRHTPEALNVLLELGLLEKMELTILCPNDYRSLHQSLRSMQHFPPTMRPGEKISPAVTVVFVVFRSNQNIQMISTYQTARYIEKYCSKIDENNFIFLSMHNRDKNTAVIKAQFLHNTKISGSAMHEDIAIQKRKDSKHPRARGKSLLEIEQIVLGYPAKHTNIEYIHVSTHPMEERKGFQRTAPIRKINDHRERQGENPLESVDDILDASLPVINRNGPLWRCFSVNQKLIAKDNLFSTVSLDKITRFSVRPPELRHFDFVQTYFAWFTISKDRYVDPLELSHLLMLDVGRSAWIDALGNQVRIRPSAIHLANQYLQHYSGKMPQPRRVLTRLFGSLDRLYQQSLLPQGFLTEGDRLEWETLAYIFVDISCGDDLPTVVFSSIKPQNATRFLVHILLSMGRFETEFELLGQPTMRAAFVKSGLCRDVESEEDRNNDFNDLLKKYITEELAFYPVSTRRFDHHLIKAKQIFYDVLISDEMPIFELPPVLFTSMREAWSDTVEREIKKMKEIHIDVCLKELHQLSGIPTKEELLNVITKENPREWLATFDWNDEVQTHASYEEQVSVIQILKDSIQKYSTAQNTFTKSVIVNGPPGCGKTFLLMVASLLALCAGLTVTPTALMAERASTLGGTYIHRLFCIPTNDYTPQRLAEVSVLRILRRPTIHSFLLALDVLPWDELGQNSAQLLATCDIILRRLRGSDLFFGGVLLICTLDHLQLRPIQGLPVLLSPHIMTCFRIVRLKYLVRSSQDEHLQRIIDICRMSKTEYNDNPGVITELKALLGTYCTWVHSWDDPTIPNNAMRIFGMRKPAQLAEARYINQVRQECMRARKPFVTRRAVDLQQPQQSHAAWTAASNGVISQLNRVVKEPAELAFFEFAVYEFTFNQPGQYSQSQLAIVCDVPNGQDVEAFRPVKVLCAPPGTKYLDFEITSKQQLLNFGWTECDAIAAPEFTRTLRGGMKARRRQYGLRPHVSNTIHAAMGATLSKVATEISLRGSCYGLWEKGQVVVLVSRTKKCCDLIFVGNKEDTLEAIVTLIQTQSQYDDYIDHILEVLSIGGILRHLKDQQEKLKKSITIFLPLIFHYRRLARDVFIYW